MTSLRVPLALDERGRLVGPADAARGASYACPCCGRPVIAKLGDRRVHHFAHEGDSNCSPETVLHKTAKLLIVQGVRDSRAGGGPAPVLIRRCPRCNAEHRQRVPDDVTDALEEYVLDNGLRVDVALMQDDAVRAAVEIYVTHEVDAAKGELLSPRAWCELAAHDVLRAPLQWQPLQDRLNRFSCQACKVRDAERDEQIEQHRARCAAIAARNQATLPDAPYVYAPYSCSRCGKEMLVFAWPGSSQRGAPPESVPKPNSVRLRFSKTVGAKYWVNVCTACNAIQGANFLHFRPNEPFFRLPDPWNAQTHLDRLRDVALTSLNALERHRKF